MSSIKPTVCVLMSTYNGELYIKQQIDSVINQEGVSVKLIIRDDGSKDNTRKIIKEFKGVELIEAKNIGCEASFMELLYMKNEADYYAFSDQDDVWDCRKLISAIENIKKNNCDLSVCNLMLVDSKLSKLHPLFNLSQISQYQYGMNNFVLGNLHGCVHVWTRKLNDIIQSYRPNVVEPHDVWVNAIANIVSSTYVDARCFINYRLHGNNVSGYTTNTSQKIIKRIKLYFGKTHPQRDRLCLQLLNGYGHYLDKSDSRYRTLYLIANYKKSIIYKLKLCFSPIINRSSFIHRCTWRCCILANTY